MADCKHKSDSEFMTKYSERKSLEIRSRTFKTTARTRRAGHVLLSASRFTLCAPSAALPNPLCAFPLQLLPRPPAGFKNESELLFSSSLEVNSPAAFYLSWYLAVHYGFLISHLVSVRGV